MQARKAQEASATALTIAEHAQRSPHQHAALTADAASPKPRGGASEMQNKLYGVST
jgi:hypothetical protein